MEEIINSNGRKTGIFRIGEKDAFGRERLYQPQVSKSPGRKNFGPGTAKNYNNRVSSNGWVHYSDLADNNGWNAMNRG